eukprot:SAG25_NODE_919_length_4769_cov_1.695289_8_plen_126_part_00
MQTLSRRRARRAAHTARCSSIERGCGCVRGRDNFIMASHMLQPVQISLSPNTIHWLAYHKIVSALSVDCMPPSATMPRSTVLAADRRRSHQDDLPLSLRLALASIAARRHTHEPTCPGVSILNIS